MLTCTGRPWTCHSRRSGRIKISDFGISKLVEATTLKAHSLVGTSSTQSSSEFSSSLESVWIRLGMELSGRITLLLSSSRARSSGPRPSGSPTLRLAFAKMIRSKVWICCRWLGTRWIWGSFVFVVFSPSPKKGGCFCVGRLDVTRRESGAGAVVYEVAALRRPFEALA